MRIHKVVMRNKLDTLQGGRALILGLLSVLFFISPALAADVVDESIRNWEKLWTAVLTQSVDQRGRIDFVSLATNHTELDQIIAFIATNDPISKPTLFQSRAAHIAYDINAYNALAMYGIVDVGIPESLGGLRKFTFFRLKEFKIGGQFISLHDFENDVIRPLGEPRVHFALNCMVVSCPQLPRTAFTAEDIEGQLDTAARAFINDDRNVRVDRDKHEVWLSSIFKFYTEDFMSQDSSLITYVNRYRTETIPSDFTVRFIDYNWTVNSRGSNTE
ncbi:MAG: DUF547 domain-containing protein [Alphaproteobacteria bacterium]